MSDRESTSDDEGPGNPSCATRLVYPAPPSPSRRSRPQAIALLIALGVGYLVVLLLVGWFLGWGRLSVVLVVAAAHLGTRRLRTVVTAETINVHHLVVRRTLPVASLTGILRDGPFRKQVSVRDQDGHRHILPQVKPRDRQAISQLTGLPIEDD